MLYPLLIAVTSALPADTLPAHTLALLGEPIATATYARIEVAPREPEPEPVASYVALPYPPSPRPGMARHPLTSPQALGLSALELDLAVMAVQGEMARGGFPGAALAIGRWDQAVVERGIGTLDRGFGALPVDPDYTIYDLASLTKVVATTMAVMLLVEDGWLQLDAPVRRYLPEFSGGNKDLVTIRHLLTHTSGLPAGAETSAESAEASLRRAINTPLRRAPGAAVEYSDIGFVVLWAAAEWAYGAPLYKLLDERVYGPLGMRFTTFQPGGDCIRCPPTDAREGYRGIVHDPIARRLGGIAGHAGLFSTVHDLGRFAAMLANGGELDGVRVIQPGTIRQFTQRQPGAGTRALGWDTPDRRGNGAAGAHISPIAYGHTGFTGTSLWIDPERGTWTVLLANRTYRPSGPNRMQALRRQINDHVALAADSRRVDDD